MSSPSRLIILVLSGFSLFEFIFLYEVLYNVRSGVYEEEIPEFQRIGKSFAGFLGLSTGDGPVFGPGVRRPIFTSSSNVVEMSEPKWPLYWVLTAPQNEDTRDLEIIESWGQNIPWDSLLFFGTSWNETVSGYDYVQCANVDSTFKAKKEMMGWVYVSEKYPDRDWYVKADDDSYLIIDTLHEYLETLDPTIPYFLGRKFHYIGPGGFQYVSGGATYVLSRAAVALLRGGMDECLKRFAFPNFEGDVAISHCLQLVGIFPEDTRDILGRERFHPFNYAAHLAGNAGETTSWYRLFSMGPLMEGDNCCGVRTTVSFHYMRSIMRSFLWPPDNIKHIHV